MQLRDFQQMLLDCVHAAFTSGKRAVLAVLPTGGGKTYTFAWLTKACALKGNRVLIVVHREELLNQASESLTLLGVEHGLIAPGCRGEREQVVVASVQTLDRRLSKGPITDFDLIVLDEAHHVGASTWTRVLAHFPKAKILGVTATPVRLDGRGLGVETGGLFDELILGPSIKELISRGFLVPIEYFSVQGDLDLEGVKRRGGDLDARDIAKRVNKPTITGCAVSHYTEHAANEPAIAFCASLDHAERVTEQFRMAGYKWETIHGKLKSADRARMLSGLADGSIHGLSSVDLISEGTNVPACSVAILLRPTLSLGLFLQQIGRILRTREGKRRGLVLDHVGNWKRHGLPDDNRTWSLDGETKKKKTGDSGPNVKQCKKCFAVWEKELRCPYCGNVNLSAPRGAEETAGELTKISKAEVAEFNHKKMVAYRSAQTYAEVLALTRKFGDKPGFAHHYWKTRTTSRRAAKKQGA